MTDDGADRITGELLLLAGLAVVIAGVVAAATFYGVSQGWFDGLRETNEPDDLNRSAVERSIHRAVNAERRDAGLEPLGYDRTLRNVARDHSNDMGARGYFDHVTPDGDDWTDRYADAGYDCEVRINETYVVRGGGENIGRISWEGDRLGVANVTRRIVESWMESPEHRKNILRPYWRREGIGVAANDTTMFVTQNFC
jgi:uncharacterized protein YkwD